MNQVVGEESSDLLLPTSGTPSSIPASLWGTHIRRTTATRTAQTSSETLHPTASPMGTLTAPATADMRDIIAVYIPVSLPILSG